MLFVKLPSDIGTHINKIPAVEISNYNRDKKGFRIYSENFIFILKNIFVKMEWVFLNLEIYLKT